MARLKPRPTNPHAAGEHVARRASKFPTRAPSYKSNPEKLARLTSWQAGPQPFDPAGPDLRVNRAAARFTSSAPTSRETRASSSFIPGFRRARRLRRGFLGLGSRRAVECLRGRRGDIGLAKLLGSPGRGLLLKASRVGAGIRGLG